MAFFQEQIEISAISTPGVIRYFSLENSSDAFHDSSLWLPTSTGMLMEMFGLLHINYICLRLFALVLKDIPITMS